MENRNSEKELLNGINNAYAEKSKECDTYRDLCGELLAELKDNVAVFSYAMSKKSLSDVSELITKASAVMGENSNG